MELSSEYEVAASADTLWEVLNDVERIAPFVPGFDLQEIDGETYRGTIKIKVGAITVSYNAEIEVLERDAAGRRVVMEVAGRERRGPGSVNARVTSTLQPQGAATRIVLATDVHVTGKVAQFGSGVLADVSASLLRQFVTNLEGDLRSGPASSEAASGGAGGSPRSRPADDVLDVGAVAGPVLLKRAAPAVLAGVVMGLLGYLVGRRR